MTHHRPKRYGFEPFELLVDEEAGAIELRRHGETIGLQDLPLRLLALLVERAPEIVPRETIHRTLWPEDEYLEFDNSLNAAVSRLRRALEDTASAARFIETVPKRGYRFVSPVTGLATESSERATVVDSGDGGRPSSRPLGTALLWALGAAIALAVGLGLLRPSPTASWDATPEARTHILRARHFAADRSRHGLERAIAEYQSAISVQPDLADGYAGLGASYALLGAYDYWRPLEAFPPARQMIDRALVIDPRSANAHLARSMVRAMHDWTWRDALEDADRAVELSAAAPSGDAAIDALPLQWRGTLRSALGDYEAGLSDLDRAIERDPLSLPLRNDRCWSLFYARRFGDAIEACRDALELDPDNLDAQDNLKWIYTVIGREADAAEYFARVVGLEGGDPEGARRRYEAEGWSRLLRDSIDSKLARARKGYQSAYDIALDYAALGDPRATVEWLRQSIERRETDLAALRVDPRLDVARPTSDFEEILRELDLATAPRSRQAPR